MAKDHRKARPLTTSTRRDKLIALAIGAAILLVLVEIAHNAIAAFLG